jgi:PPOX class probable FMN-dependent enzyme
VSDERRLTTVDELRAILGTPSPTTPHKVLDSLDATSREFLARSPFALLATADASGRPDISPRGDVPGFVHVEDDRTLLVPERKGNRLILSLQNIVANPQVGLLFVVPGTEETLRIQGRAELVAGEELGRRLTARGQPALLAIRVHVERCLVHCARSFKRAGVWRPETWTEPVPVSFGRIIAERLGRGADLVGEIDARVERGYREDL